MILKKSKLEKLMQMNFFTISGLSKAASIGTDTIVRAKRGQNISATTFKKLCEALHCKPKDLILFY